MTRVPTTLGTPFAWFFPSWTRHWAKDSALLLVSQGLTIAATSVSAILIARRLAPGDWGIFSAFLGLSFALAVFVEFGLATWLLRELSRLFAEHGDEAELEARALTASAIAFAGTMALAVVALATVGGALYGERGTLLLTLALLLLYGALFAAANVLESYLRARRRLGRVVAASVLEKYALVGLVVAAVVVGTGVWGIAVAYVSAGVLRLLLLLGTVFGRAFPQPLRFHEMRSVVRHSLPFALTSGSLNVVPRLDALVLLAFSASAAGYFALGDRILAPLVLAAAIGGTALYPYLAPRVHGLSKIWGLSAAFSAMGVVLSIAGFFAAPALVPLLFGDQYRAAVTTVRVMLLAVPITYAASPLLVLVFSSGRERAVALATWIGSLAGSGAILTGQALVGPPGAAVGFVGRQAILLAAFAWITVSTQRNQNMGVARATSTSTDVSSS